MQKLRAVWQFFFTWVAILLIHVLTLPWWCLLSFLRVLLCRKQHRSRHECFQPIWVSLKRKCKTTLRGMHPLRSTWPGFFAMERMGVQIRYYLLMEIFDALNLVALKPRVMAGGTIPVSRGLYLKLAHFGDALHVVPLLRAVRGQCPSATIDILVGPWCRDLARRIPYVTTFYSYVPAAKVFLRSGKKSCFMRELWSLLELRRKHYEVVVSTSTTSIIERVVIEAANPLCWVGAECENSLYYDYCKPITVPYRQDCYEARRIMQLMPLLGLLEGRTDLEFSVAEQEHCWAEQVVHQATVPGKRSVVAVSPGAGWPGKVWPVECFAEVIADLLRKKPVVVLLLGADNERSMGEYIKTRCGSLGLVQNMIGQTSWGQAAALLSRSVLWIGNDSALSHLSVAVGTATISIFGPTSHRQWALDDPMHRVVCSEKVCDTCRPWHPDYQCHENRSCMRSINVEQVWNEIDALWPVLEVM